MLYIAFSKDGGGQLCVPVGWGLTYDSIHMPDFERDLVESDRREKARASHGLIHRHFCNA